MCVLVESFKGDVPPPPPPSGLQWSTRPFVLDNPAGAAESATGSVFGVTATLKPHLSIFQEADAN